MRHSSEGREQDGRDWKGNSGGGGGEEPVLSCAGLESGKPLRGRQERIGKELEADAPPLVPGLQVMLRLRAPEGSGAEWACFWKNTLEGQK